MNRIILIVFMATLFSCAEKNDKGETCVSTLDNKLKREIFNECLKNIPKGPQTTKYNDWDEVVEACDSSAYWMAQVKPEGC